MNKYTSSITLSDGTTLEVERYTALRGSPGTDDPTAQYHDEITVAEDIRLYGTSFRLVNEDGTVERIDPLQIYKEIKE